MSVVWEMIYHDWSLLYKDIIGEDLPCLYGTNSCSILTLVVLALTYFRALSPSSSVINMSNNNMFFGLVITVATTSYRAIRHVDNTSEGDNTITLRESTMRVLLELPLLILSMLVAQLRPS